MNTSKTFISTFVTLSCTAALLTGCGKTTKSDSGGAPSASASAATNSAAPSASTAVANPSAPLAKDLKITFLPKKVNIPYFSVCETGAQKAAGSLGEQLKATGPSDASASSQVTYINTAAQQGQNALLIAANDSNAVAPALKAARARGMKVVAFDSDAAADARDVFINQAATEDIGVGQVKLISEAIKGSGEIAILSATANATNQNAWIAVMKKELAKPEYANVKLVDIAYGDDDDQISFTKTQGLLQAHPKLKGIISPTTIGVAAAARYLDSSEYKGKVAVTGVGTPNQLRKFIKNGTMTSFALWDPANLGYLATYAAVALASGQITGKPGEKFKAGDLGEYTIGPNSEVVLGPPIVFTKENIDKYDF
ncbi:rhamnose ABC transporter substrate-binding protein [Pendulispora brunnea]|uniref:Rhamnose ABC transporter substrate-binding protein n=1 Tax=Pendulispora brunnea TaxID=2905690 RepID=A0ABZ2KEJ1_9BACT